MLGAAAEPTAKNSPPEMELGQAGKELAALMRARALYSDMVREFSTVSALDDQFEEELSEKMEPLYARLSQLYWTIARSSAGSLDDLQVKAMALNDHALGHPDELITVFTQSLVDDLESIRKRPLTV